MRFMLICLLAMLAPPAAFAANPAATFFGNSLLCRVDAGGACELWLQPDGRYLAFFDSGKRAYVSGVGGAFQYEGSEGHYTARTTPTGLALCLTPNPDVPPRRFSRAPHLFHDAGCVALPHLEFGKSTGLRYQDQAVYLELVRGR